jgi:hypothetical protein
MKGNRLAGILAIGMTSSLLLTGCSFSGVMENVVGKATNSKEKVVATASSSEEGTPVKAMKIDKSLDKPEFVADLSGSTNISVGNTFSMLAEAEVKDGGKVTYQWFSNNVKSNGGGTPIKGATSSSFSPNTDKGGTTYYYVVAYNNKNGKVNMVTSNVREVIVWANMYWQQNADNGGFQYLNHDDGSFPSNTTMEIEGATYTFNENGYAIDPGSGAFINIANVQMLEQSEAAPEAAAPEQAAEPAAPEAAEKDPESSEDGQ